MSMLPRRLLRRPLQGREQQGESIHRNYIYSDRTNILVLESLYLS